MFRATIIACVVATALGFSPVAKSSSSMALMAKSKSLPFLEAPKYLSESMPGYAGFDPLTLSEQWMDVDWSQTVVPGGGVPIFGQEPAYGSAAFPEAGFTTPVRTPAWMQEAEIKHGRIAMLAVLGWVAVDFGLRMPGSGYESIPNSLAAHAAAVQNGSLSWLAVIAAAVELVNGVSIYEQGKGSGRIPGDFKFDPLGFAKDAKNMERYRVSEVKNGRLAMLAFSGIVTMAAAYPDKAFPYI